MDLIALPRRVIVPTAPLKFYFSRSWGVALPATLIPGYNPDTMTHHAPVENSLDDGESCGVCNGVFDETTLSTYCTNEKHGFANMHLTCLNTVTKDNRTHCPLCNWTLCLDVHENDIDVNDVIVLLTNLWLPSSRCAWLSAICI